MEHPKKKFGMVIILDALGASSFQDTQIRKFLNARKQVLDIILSLANGDKGKSKLKKPSIYTFGDTIVMTCQLSNKNYIKQHLAMLSILMKRFLFHFFEEGVMFRGAFSIGNYIEDSVSNTVMGEAVSDAATWYERSDWIGLSATPKAMYNIDYYNQNELDENIMWSFFIKYDVPLKENKILNTYAIDWISSFFENALNETDKYSHPKKKYYDVIRNLEIPLGTEQKFDNTSLFYCFINKNKKSKT